MDVSFECAAEPVTAPKAVSDLFARGVQALFRNFNAGRGVPNAVGIAALCDEEKFVRAVRHLTDAIYAARGEDHVVDASPSNAEVLDLIASVYPGGSVAPASVAPLVAPIFVVGVPRSGTTWVENMLLAHPALDGPRVETSLFVSLQALWNNAVVRAWIPEAELALAIRGFVSELLAPWGPLPGRRLVEKTPLHAEHMPLIAAVFPDASFISVHRDGRDVVQSLLEMESGTDDVVVAATRWSEITREVSATLPALARARDLRYESLLDDPVGALTELFAWLDLPCDDDVLAEVGRRAGERVSQYNTTGDVGAGKWQKLSRKQLRAVYKHAGDRLAELGYT